MITTQEEVWKPIKDYEKYYEVSNLGNVKSLHKNKQKILKPCKSGEYLRVVLQKNGTSKTNSIHKLVIQHFNETSTPDQCINHIDGNKVNNNINNLEWCTFRQNTKHAIQKKIFIAKTFRVSQYTLDKKELIRIFNSIKEAMDVTGIRDSQICANCKNKTSSAGVYFWKYTDFEYKPTPIPDGGKSLDGYLNYIITKNGEVYSKSHKKFMAKRINSGYEYISLGNGNKKKEKKDFSIHYLVAKLYIPNPNNYPMINHKNSIKTDNNVNNLEWTTYSENMKQFAMEKICIPVNKLDYKGKIIDTYKSIASASRECDISASCISMVLSKNNNRKTAGGFKWEYNKNKEIASPV